MSKKYKCEYLGSATVTTPKITTASFPAWSIKKAKKEGRAETWQGALVALTSIAPAREKLKNRYNDAKRDTDLSVWPSVFRSLS